MPISDPPLLFVCVVKPPATEGGRESVGFYTLHSPDGPVFMAFASHELAAIVANLFGMAEGVRLMPETEFPEELIAGMTSHPVVILHTGTDYTQLTGKSPDFPWPDRTILYDFTDRSSVLPPGAPVHPETRKLEYLLHPERHWNEIYSTRLPTQLSWYQPYPEWSMEYIQRFDPAPGGPVIDVGGGVSFLPDFLLDAGYREVTVLDLSSAALDRVRERLGDQATRVQWIEDNILTTDLPESAFSIWHDRAVFHFLLSDSDRRAYVSQVRRALRPGGHVVIATFHDQGPKRCSGLDVVRYDTCSLRDAFGEDFILRASDLDRHDTPAGATQLFVWCVLQRRTG